MQITINHFHLQIYKVRLQNVSCFVDGNKEFLLLNLKTWTEF